MISFLVQEGVITVGTLSGIFTAAMLNSLKTNVIDPLSYHCICKIDLQDHFEETPKGGQPVSATQNTQIKGKVFLKDFIIWLIMMVILYLIWKYIIVPNKSAS